MYNSFWVSTLLSLLSQLNPANPWILLQGGKIGGVFVHFTFLVILLKVSLLNHYRSHTSSNLCVLNEYADSYW